MNRLADIRLAGRARSHSGYLAFAVHRLSGVALAVFLPFHFLALGQAISGEAALDSFLRWTEQPVVKIAETILVVLLAAHLFGGVRVLAIEFLRWREGQARWIAWSAAASLAAGCLFLLRVFG